MVKIERLVTIFAYLIACIAFISAVKFISLPFSFLFISLLIVSIFIEKQGRYFFPKWVLTVLAIGTIALFLMRMGGKNLVIAGLEALTILNVLKFLGEKRYRDYLQIYVISTFILAGSGLLSLELSFIVYFILLFFIISLSIILLSYLLEKKDIALARSEVISICTKSFLMTFSSVPLVILIFFILPRTNFPFFRFFGLYQGTNSGFTDDVKLGDVANIQEDSKTAFRVKMDEIKDEHLYWRGIVLDFFDGKGWQAIPKQEAYKKLNIKGNIIKQEIFLEPYSYNYLFGLDKPLKMGIARVGRSRDLSYFLYTPIYKKMRYEVESIISEALPDDNSHLKKYLQLPNDISPKIKDLTRDFSSTTKDRERLIRHFMGFFKGGNFRYSSHNLPLSTNPLEVFLLKDRRGNCEYFASALAVMLRIAGVPCRLVGGYRGGYYNSAGGYYIIPQSNAHVWVEAYIQNKGWFRFDPTPADIEDFVLPKQKSLSLRIRLLFDIINIYWDMLVINYDFYMQIALYRSTRSYMKDVYRIFDGIKLNKKVFLEISSGFLILGFLVLLVINLYTNKRYPEKIILRRFTRKMEQYGYKRGKNEGLEEYVNRIREIDLQRKAIFFIHLFEGLFYNDKRFTKEDVRRMLRVIEGL